MLLLMLMLMLLLLPLAHLLLVHHALPLLLQSEPLLLLVLLLPAQRRTERRGLDGVTRRLERLHLQLHALSLHVDLGALPVGELAQRRAAPR